MTGYPSRNASFRTLSAAKKWGTKIEAEMIEGKHFRSVEARRRTLADAVDRYLEEEVPKKRGGGAMHKSALAWWKADLGHLKMFEGLSEGVRRCRRRGEAQWRGVPHAATHRRDVSCAGRSVGTRVARDRWMEEQRS